MFDALRRFRDFKGRASRSEYWLFVFFLILTNSLWLVLFSMVSGVSNLSVYSEPNDAGLFVLLLWLLFDLGMLTPYVAVAFRRAHDLNRSAAWLLLYPIFVVLSLMEGTRGSNRFGQDPKIRFDEIPQV